jgi:hypothetical protein
MQPKIGDLVEFVPKKMPGSEFLVRRHISKSTGPKTRDVGLVLGCADQFKVGDGLSLDRFYVLFGKTSWRIHCDDLKVIRESR